MDRMEALWVKMGKEYSSWTSLAERNPDFLYNPYVGSMRIIVNETKGEGREDLKGLLGFMGDLKRRQVEEQMKWGFMPSALDTTLVRLCDEVLKYMGVEKKTVPSPLDGPDIRRRRPLLRSWRSF